MVDLPLLSCWSDVCLLEPSRCLLQRKMTSSHTALTSEVFAEWKRKKKEKKEAEQAEKRAARAKEDRMR